MEVLTEWKRSSFKISAILPDYLKIVMKRVPRVSHDLLAESIGGILARKGDELSDREKALMAEILRQLVQNVEHAVRQKLAERLSNVPDAPRDVIKRLANDDIEIARPILIQSEVLQDAELIEIIRYRTLEHQLAVCMRKSISEVVSDALVDTGSERVIIGLLQNQNANISAKTMAYLVEESRRVDSFQNPIVQRRDLSPALAKRMYTWVSAALREQLVTNLRLDPATLDPVLDAAAEAAAFEDRVATRASAAAELIDAVDSGEPPSVESIIRYLRAGEIALFEEALAKRTAIERQLIRRLIYEPGGEGLALACKSSAIDKPDFATIFILSRQARPGDQSVESNEVRRVLDLYDKVDPDLARSILGSWRRDPQYIIVRQSLKLALDPAA